MSSAKAAGDAPYGQAATGGSLVPLRRLRAYKDTVARLFPALPRVCIDTWSILDHDALVIRHFLEALQHKVAVLEVGTFVGVSAYHFACQPNVTRVITVDPNPYIWDEVNDKVATIGIIVDTKQLRDLRVLDVAQAALDALHGERAKIEIKVGVLSTHSAPALSSALKVAEVSVPEPNSLDGARLVAFLDGLHSKEAVHGDLEAIFRGNPDAWVILDDCRYRWGAFVQAGVVSFFEASREKYTFRLFSDISASTTISNLGLVYPSRLATEVEAALTRFAGEFTRRFDTLALLEREAKLLGLIDRQRGDLEGAKRDGQEARREAEAARMLSHAVLASKSWRLTQPFRILMAALRRLKTKVMGG